MSILYNSGSDPSEVYYNSVDLSKVYYNGELVWESYREIVTLDYDNNIPTGVSDPDEVNNIHIHSPKGYGDLNQGSTEPDMGKYEIGYKEEAGQVVLDEYGNFIPSWRPSTVVNVTNYNTCLVEAYVGNAACNDTIQFMPTGSIGAHQYGMFTMLNNTELRALCGNWIEKFDPITGDSVGYWWNQDNLYPNNTTKSLQYGDYNPLVSADPIPDWWSEVPWNLKLGFAFHTWYREEQWQGTTIKYAGAAGPILFSKSDFATYGQAVKFSIKDLTGNRPLRCLMLPFSATGTANGAGGASDPGGYVDGHVYITKITLNTNKCEQ